MLEVRGSDVPVSSKIGAIALSLYTLKFQKVPDKPEMMFQCLYEVFQHPSGLSQNCPAVIIVPSTRLLDDALQAQGGLYPA